jgi:hypothetical protein
MIIKLKGVGLGILTMLGVFAAGIYAYSHKPASVQPKQLAVANPVAQSTQQESVVSLRADEERSHDVSNPSRVAEISSIFSIPLADNRVLTGASHDIFVGKVIRQIGTRQDEMAPGKTLPISRFLVQPILNIKGSLQGNVIVEQMGGYQDGVLYGSENGDTFGPNNRPGAGYLMQPGSTYLLATRYQSDGVYYLWAFPGASKLISQNSGLNDSQLEALAENDPRTKQLQAAYPNEILDADDVAHNNTRNSYQSLYVVHPTPSAPTSTGSITPPPPPPAPITVSTTSASSTTSSTSGN